MACDFPVTEGYGDKSKYDYVCHFSLPVHIVYVIVYVHIEQLQFDAIFEDCVGFLEAPTSFFFRGHKT